MLFYLTLIDNETDRDLFEQIYNDYKKRMLFVANRVLHDQYEAEDAVHNALIGIAKNINTVKKLEPDKVASYILTAAYKSALNSAKHTVKEEIYSLSDDFNQISDDNFFERLRIRERYDEVIEGIKSLKPIYREVLYLHYVSDLSAKKIGHLLNRKVRTVEKQIERGKQLLLIKLENTSSERNEDNDFVNR